MRFSKASFVNHVTVDNKYLLIKTAKGNKSLCCTIPRAMMSHSTRSSWKTPETTILIPTHYTRHVYLYGFSVDKEKTQQHTAEQGNTLLERISLTTAIWFHAQSVWLLHVIHYNLINSHNQRSWKITHLENLQKNITIWVLTRNYHIFKSDSNIESRKTIQVSSLTDYRPHKLILEFFS